MNYKKIIKSRSLRLKILSLLSWIPDKTMLQIQYRLKFGRNLNLKNPKRFTEKIQWYKLYYRNPDMVRCADKSDVRDYLTERGFGEYLTKTYGTYDSPLDIPFEDLPKSFVLKDTLGGGGTSVIIVRDKDKENISELIRQMQNWCEQRIVPNGGREWVYYHGKKHRIIVEEYLESEMPHGLVDYKFYCFNGFSPYVNVIFDRKLGQGKAKIFYLTRDYVDTGAYHPEEGKIDSNELIPKPENYEELRSVAEKISGEFPLVRVDLYDIKGKIYFGEMTFFDASGYLLFEPDEFDYELGECFKLPKEIIKR